MAESTGPILAIGAITLANGSVFNAAPLDWRVPIATGLAAVIFAGAETIIGPDIPRGIALLALVALCVTRINPAVPSPAETVASWWNTNESRLRHGS